MKGVFEIMQKWKTDKSLYDCKRVNNVKQLNYTEYVNEFMSQDPLRDWESIERCIKLWDFFKSKVDMTGIEHVLDAGTKDGQMVDYLNRSGYKAEGIEIDQQYVHYAKSKLRQVSYGNICDMVNLEDGEYDVVFSHHVLGLCPSYPDAYREMLRVTRSGGYVVTCNDSPGNFRKHFYMINSDDEVRNILSNCPEHDIIYFGHHSNDKELVVILRKK